MPALPTDAIAAAEFLVRHLYRPIALNAGAKYFAISETEKLGDDFWFWNDDNAKVLELMSLPEVWRRFPEETAEILRFVRSMCHAPFIFRRVSAPRLDLVATAGGVASYQHSLMQLKYDRAHGNVIAGVRFHDERNADNLMFAGNYVEFTYRRQRFKRRVPSAVATNASQEGQRLCLANTAEMHFKPRWRQRRRLGRIAYQYNFDARSMLFEVEVTLELDPGLEVSDVVLTIGHDALFYCAFSTLAADARPETVPLFRAGDRGTHALDVRGGTYYAFRQGHVSGDSLAVHSMPREPQRLTTIEAVVDRPGLLTRVIARHEFPGAHRGARLAAAEHKLLTAGGFYDRVADYAGFMREAVAANAAPEAAYDYSISYDFGVTMNAFAKSFAVAAAGGVPADPALPEELRGLFDRTLDSYFALYVDRHEQQPNVIFSRELAFTTLAVATMYRATGSDDYRRRLERLCDVLLDFEMTFDDGTGVPAGAYLMRKDSPRFPYLDCHSAALLALTHAARHVADPRLATAISRGVSSYGLETCRVPGGDPVDTVQALMIDEEGVQRTENAYWNFKIGLTLRFFRALRTAEDPALRAVAERHQDRMGVLEAIMRHQLANSVVEHPDGIEIRCSARSGETNSESQPWAMLGLVGHPFD